MARAEFGVGAEWEFGRERAAFAEGSLIRAEADGHRAEETDRPEGFGLVVEGTEK